MELSLGGAIPAPNPPRPEPLNRPRPRQRNAGAKPLKTIAIPTAHLIPNLRREPGGPPPLREDTSLWFHNARVMQTRTAPQHSSSRGGGGARGALEGGRGSYNLQDGVPFASETIPHAVQEGDTLTSIAKAYRMSVSRLATENDITDRDTLQPGDMLLVPRRAGRVGGSRAAARLSYGESDAATSTTTRFQHSHQKPAESMPVGAPPTVSSIAKAAVPLLLIAPVMGFCARCVVDYIHARVEDEVRVRFAEMESRQARRRPRVKRWQGILDEDRDEDRDDDRDDDRVELLATSATPDYQFVKETRLLSRQLCLSEAAMKGGDLWSRKFRQPTSARDGTEVPPERESDAERELRQQQDFAALQESYTKLEPLYEKFLADSGLSRSGYWRGAGDS